MYAKWIEKDGRFAFSDTDNGGVQITDEQHAALLAGEAEGKVIAPGAGGVPVLQDAKPAEPPTREQIESVRRVAYADPISGSDRHFAEAVRLEAMGDSIKAESARMLGIVRYQEIKEQYPWP